MIEYDKEICDKIFLLLKKYNYQRFVYNKLNKKVEKFDNQKYSIFFLLIKKFRFNRL